MTEKRDMPCIQVYEEESSNIVPENIIERVHEIMKSYIGCRNTESIIVRMQSEVDNVCGGKRLFEVRKSYDVYKEKVKMWESEEEVWVEKKVLNPYSLEVVFVGDVEDAIMLGLFADD